MCRRWRGLFVRKMHRKQREISRQTRRTVLIRILSRAQRWASLELRWRLSILSSRSRGRDWCHPYRRLWGKEKLLQSVSCLRLPTLFLLSQAVHRCDNRTSLVNALLVCRGYWLIELVHGEKSRFVLNITSNPTVTTDRGLGVQAGAASNE